MTATTGPTTLAIDIGASGLRASVLDATGAIVVERVRVKATYPCPPEALVAALARLVAPLPAFDRVAVGFPGMVRSGRILSASNFATVSGPGSKSSSELSVAWERFDLGGALEAALARPTRVVNDADMQGSAVVAGPGLELVVTLGSPTASIINFDGRPVAGSGGSCCVGGHLGLFKPSCGGLARTPPTTSPSRPSRR
jgi:polyphosphate glucokinase